MIMKQTFLNIINSTHFTNSITMLSFGMSIAHIKDIVTIFVLASALFLNLRNIIKPKKDE